MVSQKHNGARADAPSAIEVVALIEECLLTQRISSMRRGMEWKDKLRSKRRPEDRTQERNAMIETAQQLYEQHTQRGSPSLTLMARIHKEMSHMDFHVTKEAAGFATEAQWPI